MEQTNTPKPNALKAIVFIIILAAAIWYFFGGGETKIVNDRMQQVENKVADDAVKQYEIARRQGDKIQTYTQAGMVAAAYLQAKDEANYNKWKVIEDSCAKAANLNR